MSTRSPVAATVMRRLGDNPDRRADNEAAPPGGAFFVAVVHAEDGVRLAAAAGSRAELVRRLAEYACHRASHVLRADHARYVGTLLARGELEAAVEVYFAFVGERWDKEWLVTAAVPDNGVRGPAALIGAVSSDPFTGESRAR